MANDLDEALADVAAMAWARGALLPTSDRLREAVMVAVREDRARRSMISVRSKLRRRATPTLDQLRDRRERERAQPTIERVAAAYDYSLKALLRGRAAGAVAARDALKWELLADGLSAESAGRVLLCHGFLVSRGADRHADRVRAAGRVLRRARR